MIAGLPVGSFFGLAGGWAAAAFIGGYVLRLVLTGKLVTRQQLQDKIDQCGLWQTAAENWQAAAHEQGMAVIKLTASVDASNYALSQIQVELTRERSE